MPRLLLIACSATKRDAPGPAIHVYDGPLYRVLRKNSTGDLVVAILSAEYGLISADTGIEPYDQRMTSARAAELQPQVDQGLASIAAGSYSEVYIEVGHAYRKALPDHSSVATMFECPITFGQGRIGERMRALKAWLSRAGARQGETDD